MATQTLKLELPQELIDLLGSTESAATRAKEALVLELLREAQISQGRAAELLGISRWEMLELMAKHRILSGPETAEEIAQEIETARRLANES